MLYDAIGTAALPEPATMAATKPPAYPLPTTNLTQSGPLGITFDFNQGARVILPPRENGALWGIKMYDLDAGNLLFETKAAGAFVASAKKFFVRFRIEVYDDSHLVFEHDYDAKDREVLIQFPVGTLGDILAWFPYAEKFRQAHGCKLTCSMSDKISPLLKSSYPDINFVSHEEQVAQGLNETAYATYCLGLFFEDAGHDWQPSDFRMVGLHRTAGYILGVDPAETPAIVALDDDTRPIPEPYVCIAVQSTSAAKMWLNPTGWQEVVAHIKALGYRVICIDQKPLHGQGLVYSQRPYEAEDQTGDRPLMERARWLKHASAFVGLSSGLSWLAWSMGTPVVLISGFTHPQNEFATPFRVINWHACNSCWNDPGERFPHDDFMWCPRHRNTERHFECTRLITAAHVNAQVERALGVSHG